MLLQDYAPFFREGLLYLPETTIKLLIESGLDSSIAQLASQGLRLDDDRHNIGVISNQLETVLANLSSIHGQLTSHETQFMLSDIDQNDTSTDV